MSKRLVVCGDSFHSVDEFHNGFLKTHYSEILANNLSYDLCNLAIPAASYPLIALQILEAIDLNPDIIIVGQTSFNRVIYKLKHIEFTGEKTLDWNLGHIKYDYRSHPYIGLSKKTTEHVRVRSIVDVEYNNYKEELAKYYSSELESKFDIMSFTYAIIKLVESRINFLLWYPDPYFVPQLVSNEKHPFIKYCNNDNLITENQFDLYSHYREGAPVYHTSCEVQVEVAKYLEKRIREKFYV